MQIEKDFDCGCTCAADVQEGEEAWMLGRQKSTHGDLESQQLLRVIDEDPDGVVPTDVADEDSCFITIGTMLVHYKIARSQVGKTAASILLLLGIPPLFSSHVGSMSLSQGPPLDSLLAQDQLSEPFLVCPRGWRMIGKEHASC